MLSNYEKMLLALKGLVKNGHAVNCRPHILCSCGIQKARWLIEDLEKETMVTGSAWAVD